MADSQNLLLIQFLFYKNQRNFAILRFQEHKIQGMSMAYATVGLEQ